MSKKSTGALLLAALCVLPLGRDADASLFGLPKSLKTSPLDGVEMSLRIWQPSPRGFACLQHLSACQAFPPQLATP